MLRHWLLACALVAGTADAADQVPDYAFRSMLLRVLTHVNGALNFETRSSLLDGSGLTEAQVASVLRAVDDVAWDLLKPDSEVAKARRQPEVDLQSYENRRREFLDKLDAEWVRLLGKDAYDKLRTFLDSSFRQRISVHLSVGNNKAVAYTYGTTIQCKDTNCVAGIAVTDTDYTSRTGRLYAEVTVKSPEGREVMARSPAISFNVHAAAYAVVPLWIEDGRFDGLFRHGEICLGEQSPRLYPD